MTRAAPSPRATSTDEIPSVAIPMLGEPEERERQEFALRALLHRGTSVDLRSYLLTHRFDGVIPSTVPAESINASVTGSRVIDLGHLAARGVPLDVTVLLSCASPTRFQWTLTAFGPEHDDPVVIHSHGPACSGRVLMARTVVAADRVPTHLDLTVGPGTRAFVTVFGSAVSTPGP